MITFKIAKNELRYLFYSPVAWFVILVFLVTCIWIFIPPFYKGVFLQDLLMHMDLNPKFKDFEQSQTLAVFFSADGIFVNIFQYLYLFTPLLTMGLLSREINNGTNKLLYSSPVRLRHIVMGKYLGIMLYNLLLLGIVSLTVIIGILGIQSVDIGYLLSSMLGLFLLMAAYSAIGMFMSSLTNYQIVSGIASFVVIFILNRMGTLWQKYDVVRDVTWSLSIASRTNKMMAGLITSRDVIYFLIITFTFISFTLFRLKGQRESKPWSTQALRYLAVTAITIFIGYISSRPGFISYWDTTALNVNTIHPRTQELLKKMGKDTLEVTLYTNQLGANLGYGLPEVRNADYLTFWEAYQRFKSDIKFKYVYYYYNGSEGTDTSNRAMERDMYANFPHKTEKQIVGINAKINDLDSSLFIGPEEIRKQIDPYQEDNRLFMRVKYKGKTINLRTYLDNDHWPNEQEVNSKLKRLMNDHIPKIYFLTGNLERNIHKTGEREYSGHSINKAGRGSLINLGFEVDTLSLEKQDIPRDATELIIADPKTELQPATLNKLRSYVDKGGNLLILGEPGKQAMLNPVLQQIGIHLMNGQLVQLDKNETPDKVTVYTDSAVADLSEGGVPATIRKLMKRKMAYNLSSMMAGATALSYTANGGFTFKPLLGTVENQKGVWLKTGHLVTDSVPPVFSPQEGDTKGPAFITAASLTRQVGDKQQRIIVCGDADFFSNMRITANFYDSFYSWLDDNKYPVYLPVLGSAKDVKYTFSLTTANVLKIVYLWVLPGVALLGA
ncbi:MAG: Gldg family protein, partial [Mucilaginibacter sp.]